MSPKTLSLLAGCLLALGIHTGNAQAKVTWGDEFKMHKGSTDLNVVHADASGTYLIESHNALKSYFVFGATFRTSGTLVKLGTNMSELYRNDFDSELKGKEYESLLFIRDKLYLFATDFSKKDNSLYLYAAEIDKGTGNLKGDWQQVYAWEKLDKSEKIDYHIGYNSDSSNIVVTGTYSGREQNRYEIKMMDASLHPVGKPMTISNEFDPKTFVVEDFLYTPTGNAVLVGRVYEYAEGKRQKEKNLLFKNYSIRLYNPNGKLINDVKTDINDKFLVNSKVIQLKNELVLAAFYSEDKKKREINGLMVQRLDPATGKVLATTDQQMKNGLVSSLDGDEDEQNHKKDKQDDEAGLESNLVFRNFYVAPDQGLVILAEQYTHRVYSGSSYSYSPTFGGSSTHTTTVYYNCGNIYMARIAPSGNIDWLHVLPKNQVEQFSVGSYSYGTGISFYSYFIPNDNRPFYAGFSSMAGKNTVHLFFNDHEANGDILEPGKKLKKFTDWGTTTCYIIDLDMITGKYTRKPLYSNKEIPTSMPRLGVVLNNDMYFVGKQERTMAKTKIAVGRITCAL